MTHHHRVHAILVGVIILAWASPCIARAQGDTAQAHFTLFGIVATSSPTPAGYGYPSYYAGSNVLDARTQGIELVYGPMVSVNGMTVSAFANLSYTNIVSRTLSVATFTAPMSAHASWDRIPILAGLRFSTPSRISPYVEFAGGITRALFKEHVGDPRERAISLGYWAFAYEFGAGFEFKVSRRITLMLFLKNVTGDVPDHERDILYGHVSSNTETREFMRGFSVGWNF
jgi:opacity protein-like surface antigen